MYEERTYRNLLHNSNAIPFQVSIKETDLYVRAHKDLRCETMQAILQYRKQIEEYIRRSPEFHKTLVPIPLDPFAPEIIRAMIEASRMAGVGPMAAVAGVISEFVGRELLRLSDEIIVENGGDIFLKTTSETRVGIYAGISPLSNRLGIKIKPGDTPLGICTSSGTVGHSTSFGKADAVTVLSRSTPVADAAATSIGNLIQDQEDFDRGLEFAHGIDGVMGVLIILGGRMAVWGQVELIELKGDER